MIIPRNSFLVRDTMRIFILAFFSCNMGCYSDSEPHRDFWLGLATDEKVSLGEYGGFQVDYYSSKVIDGIPAYKYSQKILSHEINGWVYKKGEDVFFQEKDSSLAGKKIMTESMKIGDSISSPVSIGDLIYICVENVNQKPTHYYIEKGPNLERDSFQNIFLVYQITNKFWITGMGIVKVGRNNNVVTLERTQSLFSNLPATCFDMIRNIGYTSASTGWVSNKYSCFFNKKTGEMTLANINDDQRRSYLFNKQWAQSLNHFSISYQNSVFILTTYDSIFKFDSNLELIVKSSTF